jgi:hypothetical protein
MLEDSSGGAYNWRIMYFAPDWDSLDDVWNAAFEAFGQDERAWTETLRMIEARDDAIWRVGAMPRPLAGHDAVLLAVNVGRDSPVRHGRGVLDAAIRRDVFSRGRRRIPVRPPTRIRGSVFAGDTRQ